MSLINDALKQARCAQPGASATADGPILRPDFSQRRSPVGTSLLLAGLIVVSLLLAALLLLQWFRSGSEITVSARTTADSQTVQTAPAPQSTAPAAAAQPFAQIAPEKTATDNLPVASTTPASASQPTPATNASAIVAAPAPPPPLTYKLQSLFYRAKDPSAVINGKTLFIGDRVGEAHVVAIDKDSVTIKTRQGETKILELAY